MVSRNVKAVAAGLVLLGVWGAVKIPWEMHLAQDRASRHFASAVLTRDVRDQISQGAAIALLAGFRGVVADFVWLGAHIDFENRRWVPMRTKLVLATTLRPRSIQFWQLAAWHMAWNAANAARNDPEEPRLIERIRHEREWIEAGRALLERGIESNPDRYDLYFHLGWLLERRAHEPGAAVRWFEEAAKFEEAPPFVTRSIGRALEAAGDREGALKFWRRVHAADPKRSDPSLLWDVIERRVRALEEALDVPPGERLYPK